MQKTYKLLLLNLFIITLFIGCTPPSAFTFFKDDKLKAEAIQYTKTVQIAFDGQVQAIINVTYLNSVNDDFDEDQNQNFIVGVFIANDNEQEDKQFLNNPSYSLSLNGRVATYTSKLSDQHKMYGHLPIQNNWAKYYLVKFDVVEDETTLTLNFSNLEKNISSSISFEDE